MYKVYINKWQFSIQKKYGGGDFTSTSISDYKVKVCWWEWGKLNLLILLMHGGRSHFLNIAFYAYFCCIYLCGTKFIVLKTDLYLVWGGIWYYIIKRFCVSGPLCVRLYGIRNLSATHNIICWE